MSTGVLTVDELRLPGLLEFLRPIDRHAALMLLLMVARVDQPGGRLSGEAAAAVGRAANVLGLGTRDGMRALRRLEEHGAIEWREHDSSWRIRRLERAPAPELTA